MNTGPDEKLSRLEVIDSIRIGIEASLDNIQKRIDIICKFESFRFSKSYLYAPNNYWIGGVLQSDISAEYQLSNYQDDPDFSELGKYYNDLHNILDKCLKENEMLILQQCEIELLELVSIYHSRSWIEAIHDGMSHEMYYINNIRDVIECYKILENYNNIHNIFELEIMIEDTDKILKIEGLKLWSIIPGTSLAKEIRYLYYPRSHWWWWIDDN